MRDKASKSRRIGKENSGFSLLAVMVSVSFIGILGLLVLYMALSNFQMKITDLKGKDSFYTAERALEEIRVGLQQDVGDSMSEAYIKVLETYNKEGMDADVVLDQQRQNDFEDIFINKLANRLKNGKKLNEYSLEYLTDNYLDLNESSNFDGAKETLIVTTPSEKTPEMKIGKNSGIVLKNLKVIYVDPKGYASVIQTDIRLGIPKVQFPTPSTLPDLMNMIVVADGGIICESGENASAISGSIYSGVLTDITDATILDKNPRTSIWVQPGASLKINSGDKVVSEGEIYVGQNGSFTAQAGVTLWAQGVKLSSAQVELLGTTYLSDDLTIESGNSSKVTVQGEYYGYGYPESARISENSSLYSGWNDTALSSAIVINGKNTTLDLSGLRKILVAGRSYIGTSQVPSVQGTSNSSDIMMGESITVKGTQLAYLLPPELIDTSQLGEGYADAEMKNPMSYVEYETSGLMSQNTLPVKLDTPVEAWGGKTLREIGVDIQKPVQEVFYNNNAEGGYVYFYLNFKNDAQGNRAASDFMYAYYKDNDTIKANMDEYLSFYFSDTNAGIQVKDMKNYIRYVTNGNVLSYKSDSGDMEQATSAEVSQSLLQEQVNYQNTWYALNRKMITSVELMNKEVKDSDGLLHDETESSRSVFDNLVNEKEMVQFLQEKASATNWAYHFESDEKDGGLCAVMLHNGKSSTFDVKRAENVVEEVTVNGSDTTFVIDSQTAQKLRLVVCTGDVKIEAGVHFQGIIMTKGKIILGAGASLESAPLEAAKVFQAQMESDENVSPKHFFWEGDKYVLGNSSVADIGTDTGRVSDTYDLADCITYENWTKR